MPEQRPQLAKHAPLIDSPYTVYWFADVRNERAHACSCPDYFHRNIVAGDPSHLCVHLLRLAPEALRAINANCPPESSVDEVADALGVPHQRYHVWQNLVDIQQARARLAR